MLVENALAVVVWTPIVVSTVRLAALVARFASATRKVIRFFYRAPA